MHYVSQISDSFYCATLCQRGCYGPVSVSVSVCVCHKLEFYVQVVTTRCPAVLVTQVVR